MPGRAARSEYRDLLVDYVIGLLGDREAGSGLLRARLPTSKWGETSDRLEGVARTMLPAAFLTRSDLAAEDLRRLRDTMCGLVEDGVTGQTDRWPRPTSSPQHLVEAASLSLAMLIARDSVWSTLAESARTGLVMWLRGCRKISPSNNNWILFPLVIDSFLLAVGEISRLEFERHWVATLKRIDKWYGGNGWYSDGNGRVFDYYNSFAFHFYLPLIANEVSDLPESAIIRGRLASYTTGLRRTIASDGEPLAWGRSLTYKFGLAAPLAVAALVDPTSSELLELGSTWGEVLAWWDARRILRDPEPVYLGWTRDDLGAVQRYSGAYSSNWALKAFVALMVKPDSEFWTGAQSEPLGSELSPVVGPPGVLLERKHGVATMHNHGIDHQQRSVPFYLDDEMYTKAAAVTSVAAVSKAAHYRPLLVGNRAWERQGRGVVAATTGHRGNVVGSKVTLTRPIPVVARLRILDRGRLRWIGPRVRGSAITLVSGVASIGGVEVAAFAFSGSSCPDTAVFDGWASSPAFENSVRTELGTIVGSSDGVIVGLRPIHGWLPQDAKNERITARLVGDTSKVLVVATLVGRERWISSESAASLLAGITASIEGLAVQVRGDAGEVALIDLTRGSSPVQ